MTGRARTAVLLVCAAVVLAAAWYAGAQYPTPAPPPAPGSVRLGPDPGEDVDEYLARLPAELPPPGAAALALVQLADARPVPDAAALVAGVAGAQPVAAVLRISMPRVQTALRFEDLEPGVAVPTALDTVRQRAQREAATEAAGLPPGRPADVAAAEARSFADPAVPCVLALVVQAPRAGLEALVAAPGVRAVHAAPVGVTARELALAPLLPEQSRRADPPPDDGPVVGA